MKTYFGRISIKNNSILIESVRLILDSEKKSYEIEFSSYDRNFQNYKIIQGLFNGLGEVTLINCTSISSQSGAGASIKRYRIDHVLIGDLISDDLNHHFESAEIQMQGLLEWTKLYSVEYQRNNNIRYLEIKNLDKITVYESIKWKINISASSVISVITNPAKRTISEKVGFEIISNSERKSNFWDYLKVIRELQKILLILGNENTEISLTNLFIKEKKHCELLSINTSSFGKPSVMAPILKFEDVKNNLNHIIATWFSNNDLHTSIDLILEKAVNSQLSRENYFLNNCFSIETFHRRFKNYKLFNRKDFKSVKGSILSNITNEEIREIVSNSLAHINEPNFRKRLFDFEEDFKVILPAELDVKEYIGRIVKTRNFLVHRGSTKKIFDKFDMLYAAIYLENIIRISIFRILGVDEKICDTQLKQQGLRINGFYVSNKNRKFEA